MCLESADDLPCFRSLQLFFLGLTTIFCVLGHPVIAVDPEATNLAYLYKSLGRYYCTAFMYLLYFAYFMSYIFYLFVMEKSLGRYYCCAARAFCDCPAIISHRPRSQNILKEPQLNLRKIQE
jgi:hypothetical protein